MPTIKAIVTGHTHGLGAALRAQLLERHIPVLGLARSCPSDTGPAPQVQLDLSAPHALQAWLATPQLRAFLGDCDLALLFNNAGVVAPVGPLEAQDTAEVAMAVALNVGSPLMLAAAVAQRMVGRQTRIVHVSSGAGSGAYPGWSVYCATKAALDHHARAVALDATPGVRICSLAPGVIDTGMQAQIRATPVERFPMLVRFVEMKASGSLVSPEDCARGVVDYALSARFGNKPVDDLRNA